jgi:ankyrin repeat protein
MADSTGANQAVIGISDLSLMISCGPEEPAIICERGTTENIDMLATLTTENTFKNGACVKMTLNCTSYSLSPHVAEYDDIFWSTIAQDCSQFIIETLESDKFVSGTHFRLSLASSESTSTSSPRYVSRQSLGDGRYDMTMSDGITTSTTSAIVFEVFNVDQPSSEEHAEEEADQSQDVEEDDIIEVYSKEETISHAQSSGDDISAPSECICPPAPKGSTLVKSVFADGPLGVTLKRRQDGVVYVQDTVPNTQAVAMDIKSADELWMVGSYVIGERSLGKDEWGDLITYIKECPRPVEIYMRRYLPADSDVGEGSMVHSVSSSSEVGSLSSYGNVSIRDSPDHRANTNVTAAASAENINTSEESSVPIAVPMPIKTDPVNVVNEDLALLRKLASRLIIKDKGDTTSFATYVNHMPGKQGGPISGMAIVKDGRKLLKNGLLSVAAKRALWNVQNKRHFFLLNDVLLVTEPQSDKYLVRDMIDLSTCKINIAVVSDLIDESLASSNRIFELLYPGGSLVVICNDDKECFSWIGAVRDAILEGVDDEEKVLGWRHQYVLGTMHSAVLSRDVQKVRALLQSCDEGKREYLELENKDEDGYTPLHYACILRMRSIVKVLHDYNTDVTTQDSRGLTALHWSALQLDDESLEMLCSNVFDVDFRDDKERTPLYLACVEGKGVSGYTDTSALKRCVQILLGAGANPNVKDQEGYTVMHFACASWEYEVVDVLLSKPTIDVNICSDQDGTTPLHLACTCVQLKRAVGEGTRVLASHHSKEGDIMSRDTTTEAADIEHSLRTVLSLLSNGASPNVKDFYGRSPAAMAISHSREWGSYLLPILVMLATHGARIDEQTLLDLNPESLAVIQDGVSEWNRKGVLDGDFAKVT